MLQPGTFISDRYEIIEIVGSGGMAYVYKAKCHRLNRFVAIKVLKPEYSGDINFVNKFRGEAQSVAGLSHPNIVSVYDVGDDEGLHYIVMELVEGITLKKFIEKKGKLEIKEAVGIAIQIAQGMEAAHNNHIIHRDIKPQNIIISRDGKVMVTDFGIAKAATSNTITSNTMGSVHYLSPEQARGGYSDEKSDIYSLGITIYEMLSGRVPFVGDNTVSVALLHIQGEAISLNEIDSKIPISIDKIVQKCMQKKPERRYHTTLELILDLKKSLTEPSGNFVHIPDAIVSDSPTINISEDLLKIKSGTLLDATIHNTSSEEDEELIDNDNDEYDELDAVDSKIEKIFLIGSIAGVVIIGLLIIFFIGWFFGFWGDSKKNGNESDNGFNTGNLGDDLDDPTPTDIPDDVDDSDDVNIEATTFSVPNVVGHTEDDAVATIKLVAPDIKFRYKEGFSDVVPKDQIMEQYPAAYTEWDAEGEIILTRSLGSEPFRLPSLDGLTEEKAEKKLNEVGLKINHEYPFNDDIKEGHIIKTEPESGDMVMKGDVITLYVSSGPEVTQAEVPSLLGFTQQEARNELAARGLDIGVVSLDYSTIYPKDQVTYQSNSVGQKVSIGSKIDITISKGPEPTATPTPTPPPAFYRYIGEVIINANPFDYIDEDEAEIVLELEQDGWVTQVYEGNVDSSSFPLKVTGIEGDSTTDGTIRMYVDDILFKMPDESDAKTWRIKFMAVEE